MNLICRMVSSGIIAIALVCSPIAYAGVSPRHEAFLMVNLENDSQLLNEMKEHLSASASDVKDIKIIRVIPNGQDKAIIFFEFKARHLGNGQQHLAVSDLVHNDSGWHMTNWGGGGEDPKPPFTLGRSQSNDDAPVYYGVIHSPTISRIVVETNGSMIDIPIINKDSKRYFFGVTNFQEYDVNAVTALDDRGKVVYQITMNH